MSVDGGSTAGQPADAASDAVPALIDPLTLLTASVKAVKEDARKKTAGEAPRPAMFDGLRDEPALASLAASATPVNVAAGEPVATAGEVTGAGAGALFVVARGVASVTTAPDRTRSLGPGDHFGDLVVASGGDAGFPATLTAGPDGVTAYAFPLAAVQTACASCDLARLVVRAAARDTTRRFADVPGAALPARGVDLVLVADALPNANALVHLARDKGAVADTYPHHGTLDGTLEAARALLGDRRAATAMLAVPGARRGEPFAVRVVDGQDASVASLGGDVGADAAEPVQRSFWSALGELCEPWGCVAVATAPGSEDDAGSPAEDFAAAATRIAGVEVTPPYQLGRERSSEAVEATEAAVTRAAAKQWRAEALEPTPNEEDKERKEQEAAAVKIQAVHRGKAARKEVEERKEQEAAAVKIQAVHRGKAARKDLSARHPLKPSSPSTVHRSSSSTRPTPTTRKPSESLVTSSPSRASAPSTSESRVSASCKKLGIDPAAVAAQLAAFPAPQIEIPLRSGVPPPDTPALACLLLLENRQMSFRVRSEFELRDLRLATEFAEASAALKLPAGAAALVTFKRKGEALVRAVRRRAIRDGLLRPTARDEKRLEAMRAESSAAKRRDADLLAKRDAENAAAARARRARAAEKEKEATEAREKEARRRRRSMASVGVEGDFLERLSRDMRRRETELRATLAPATRRSDFRFDDAPREREEADRRYLRSVIRERLVREGVYRPAENEGGLPRDDAGLVAVVRQHAASLGVRWPRRRAARSAKKKGAANGDEDGNASTEAKVATRPRTAEETERRRAARAARDRRKACARLRRADFMRRYEADVERRGLSTAAARARGVTGSNPGSGASPARARVRRRAMSEFGDGDGAASDAPPSPRSVGADVKFSRYRRRLEEADEAIEAMAELKRKGGREDARPVTADAPVGILKKTGATAPNAEDGGVAAWGEGD